MQVSIIIPCYNALDKIGRCIASLRTINWSNQNYEIIFVDDCSTDGTHELLCGICDAEKNWFLYKLEKNSGSPSRPRNLGTEKARGNYVFFLDCDDEIYPQSLPMLYSYALEKKADVVRGYLVSTDGRSETVHNRIPDWSAASHKNKKIEKIIQYQSTTPPGLISLSLLRDKKVSWPEDIRMGEDTLFLADVLINSNNIEYVDAAIYIYNKRPALTPSSTQSYGDRELSNHLRVWRGAISKYSVIDIDYRKIRLQIGLQTALHSLVKYRRGRINQNLFIDFSGFINEHWLLIERFNFSRRNKEILTAIKNEDFILFNRLSRPRLLIAGYDLKFIKPIMQELEDNFDIQVDEWTGHDEFNESDSVKKLSWAELIWCEWLLGNAAWYSKNKSTNQKLIVRMHRFELSRDFGEKIVEENIDAYVTVSPLFFEKLLERFPKIPREKVRYIPNFVRLENYERNFNTEKIYTLAMVGILPSRKGLHRALEILKKLRMKDKRYKLEIFGKAPNDLSWIARNPVEMSYFKKCDEMINSQILSGAVNFNGHCDISVALSRKNVGFVLSTSDSDDGFPGPESFHLAVADGFAAGGIGLILKWSGSEYIWPSQFILENLDDVVKYILDIRDSPDLFSIYSNSGREFLLGNYSVSNFTTMVNQLSAELL